ALMGKNPSSTRNPEGPVEQVSWNDAMSFCQLLTTRERAAGRLPAGHVYTLPTEAQWEYACRAGSPGDYAAPGDINALGWHSGNSQGHPQPVATKTPNAWGFYDMHGNVQEWCSDWFGPYPGGEVTDPRGATSGVFRVYRGGSWSLAPAFAKSVRRQRNDPNMRVLNLGFRLALTPSSETR
ncbi:MAG: hypothetical protein RIQ79_1905, partial [Verrucomicrobiota bacterium]